jgi:hypothetical protein
MTDRRLAAALVALAVAARAAAVLALQSHTVPRSTYEHGEIAANLLAGRGFAIRFLGADGPTSQQAPLYPVLVAAAFAIGGVETPTSLLILELAQAALGGVMVLGVLALAAEAAPGRRAVAIASGLIAALHPTLVYAATHVQVAPLAATLLAWTLALALRAGRTGRAVEAAGVGLLLGLLALTDPILILAAPGAAWAMLQGRRPRGVRPWARTRDPGPAEAASGPRMAVRLALAGLVAAAVVAPWIARNAAVHGEFVFIKSTFGYAFWQGNCALSEGTDKVVRPSVEAALAARGDGLRGLNEALWRARHEAGYVDDIALTAADKAALGRLPEPERSRVLFRRALDDLRADPARYPALCLRRLRYFLLFDETNPKTRSLVYRVPHAALTALALLGWLAMAPEVRRRLAPSAITAVLIAAFHALTITSARFHVPLEPLMACWAGAGLSRLAPPPRPAPSARRRTARTAPPVGSVGG